MGASTGISPYPPGTMCSTSPSTISTHGQNVRPGTKRKRNDDAKAEAQPPTVKNLRPNEKRGMKTPKDKRRVDQTANESPSTPRQKVGTPKGKAKSSPPKPPPERRARVFRSHPPKSFQVRLERVRTQRMCIVKRQTVSGDGELPKMEFVVVGSTGNLYTTTIGKEPTCDCPDALKGNQCKHITYVLVKALKAPTHLQYQLAFLSSELREIYQNSPFSSEKAEPDDQTENKRKPVEGDCPICFMEFEPDKEEIVWCQAACGNNIHKTCFQQWAVTQRAQGVRCVYCRSEWKIDDGNGMVNVDLEQLLKDANVEDGYVNVAEQMGLSRERDSSTYYTPSAHQRSYYGWRSRGYY